MIQSHLSFTLLSPKWKDKIKRNINNIWNTMNGTMSNYEHLMEDTSMWPLMDLKHCKTYQLKGRLSRMSNFFCPTHILHLLVTLVTSLRSKTFVWLTTSLINSQLTFILDS